MPSLPNSCSQGHSASLPKTTKLFLLDMTVKPEPFPDALCMLEVKFVRVSPPQTLWIPAGCLLNLLSQKPALSDSSTRPSLLPLPGQAVPPGIWRLDLIASVWPPAKASLSPQTGQVRLMPRDPEVLYDNLGPWTKDFARTQIFSKEAQSWFRCHA